eukprot:Gb_15363 [translate_table: standard]
MALSYKRQNHINDLRVIFERCRKYWLSLNPEKCVFLVSSGKLLGHLVSIRGIEPDLDKVKAIIEMPPPRTQKQIKSFLGKLGYLRRFIADFAFKAKPLTELLKTDVPFYWSPQANLAFEQMKEALTFAPILMPPSFDKPFILYTSATNCSLGCMLAQKDDTGKERAIFFTSQTLIGYELNYTFVEKQCLALVFATKKLRQYLINAHTDVYTQFDLLLYLLSKPDHIGRAGRWAVLLQEFDLSVVKQKSKKGMIVAEHLADLPLPKDKNELVEDSLPDKNIFHVDQSEITTHEWHKDIVTYLESQEYPQDSSAKQKKRICATTCECVILGNTLYKRSFNGILLRCLSPVEAQKVL